MYEIKHDEAYSFYYLIVDLPYAAVADSHGSAAAGQAGLESGSAVARPQLHAAVRRTGVEPGATSWAIIIARQLSMYTDLWRLQNACVELRRILVYIATYSQVNIGTQG